jgi:hypothetical protein
MNSTTLYKTEYTTTKQRLIEHFNGAEECIHNLELAIEERPASSRAITEKNGFFIYEKSTYIKIFDTLMYEKNTITIRYALHKETNTIILTDIYSYPMTEY